MRLALPLIGMICMTASTAGDAKPRAPLRTYSDPVAYCSAVGTALEPGRQYRGPREPEWLRRKMGASGASETVVWRCRKGRLLACVNGGITGRCDRMSISRAPTRDMREFCQTESEGQSIPSAVTGHYTPFDWACKGGTPIIRRQFSNPDAQGFIADEWRFVARR